MERRGGCHRGGRVRRVVKESGRGGRGGLWVGKGWWRKRL